MWTSSSRNPPVETLPPEYEITSIGQFERHHLDFYNSVVTRGDGNQILLDTSMPSYGYTLEIKYKGATVGIIAAIPHYVEVGSSKILSAHITSLALHKDHRHKGYAGALIINLMKTGFKDGIKSGYFFRDTRINSSSLEVVIWYKPLDIDACLKHGYQIPIPNVEGAAEAGMRPIDVAHRFYSFKSHYLIRRSRYDDFEGRFNRPVMVIPSENQFQLLASGSLEWVTIEESPSEMISSKDLSEGVMKVQLREPKMDPTCEKKISDGSVPIPTSGGQKLALAAIKPFSLQTTGGQNINAGLLAYFEVYSTNLNPRVLMQIIETLSAWAAKKYICLHGSSLGALSFGHIPFGGPILGVPAGKQYLHFYNIDLGANARPEHFSVLRM